jgi:hypothetical protein
MLIRKINNHTAIIGADQGYLSLPLRQTIGDSIIGGKTVRVEKTETAWEPTPSELEALNQGASIIVQQLLFGQPFPPIYLYTESPDEDSIDSLDRMKQQMNDSIDSALECIQSEIHSYHPFCEEFGMPSDPDRYQALNEAYDLLKTVMGRLEAL